MQKVKAEIHLKHIKNNAEAFKRFTGKKLCAVVKADGYGHGAEEVALAIEHSADLFAVALLEEAVALRVAACGKDILILTPPTCFSDAERAIRNGFILTVDCLSRARLIEQAAQKLLLPARIHLKVNTGMNRYGMSVYELGKTCKYLQKSEWGTVEGLYSHLHDLTRESAQKQREKFLQMQAVCKRYFTDVTCHLSATYGTLLGEEFFFDMTRVGLGLYGYIPDGAEDIEEKTLQTLALEKGMTVYATAVASRKYSHGSMGYGKALEESARERVKRLSVVRYGYADGFFRKKENGVEGSEKHANPLCMDACVKIGGVKTGARICLIDDAQKTAQTADTISYEVLCAATKRAERISD